MFECDPLELITCCTALGVSTEILWDITLCCVFCIKINSFWQLIYFTLLVLWCWLNHLWPYHPKWIALILGHNTECDDFWSAGQKYWFSVFIKIRCFGYFSVQKHFTFNGQIWCFMTVSGILNCNCCNTLVCKMNFLSRVSQNGTLRMFFLLSTTSLDCFYQKHAFTPPLSRSRAYCLYMHPPGKFIL